MKAILKFDLDDPDDKRQHDLALKGKSYSMFVWDYWNEVIRPLYKHDLPEKFKDGDALLEHMRTQFLEYLHEYGLKTDI